MSEWAVRALESPEFGWVVLPAAIILGFVASIGSGCNIAVIAAVAGYAGSSEIDSHRNAVITAACFLIGTILALTSIGALIGHLGQAAGDRLGLFGKLFAGFIAVFFGLTALNLLPFRLPQINSLKGKSPKGILGSAIFGFAIGGVSITCTLVCCGPLLPMVLGMAALRGQGEWGAMILMMFAIGFSLPLAAMMFGVSIGKMTGFAAKAGKPIKTIAGVILIAAGFWILTTI